MTRKKTRLFSNRDGSFHEVIAAGAARTRRGWAALLTVAALALAGVTALPARADEATVRVGTDGAYPPYNSTTPSGQLVGFEIDLINDLCRRMQRRCELVAVDWNAMIPKLQDGSVDVIMSALSIRPERRKVIDFTLPYFSAPTYFVVRQDSRLVYQSDSRIIDLAQPSAAARASLALLSSHLSNAVIGVEGATTHEDVVRQMFPGVGRIRVYPKQEGLFLDLIIGRVDAVYVGYANASRFIKDQTARGRKFSLLGPGMRGGPLGEGVAFGLRKNETGLVERMNEALRAGAREGFISKLSRQWFGIDGSIHYDPPAGATAQAK
ncbi:MAG: transporter substrate-binding domain-containing protein [Proteobacteria bacterium]|nr:transporter substrate-binding domain-containing protein [Pseudomonadota bacterium]